MPWQPGTIKKQEQNTHSYLENKKEMATFTYSMKKIRKITKLFQDTNLKIAFHPQHVIENIPRPKPHIQISTAKVSFYHIKCVGF
jgi:UV DNA damage repair endonuclease